MEKQSDATSVQPLWHSLVDLSIIGLDVEDGDAGVTVGGEEEDLRTRVRWYPSIIGSSTKAAEPP